MNTKPVSGMSARTGSAGALGTFPPPSLGLERRMIPVGAVEAGGTKFVCAIGTGPDDLRRETIVPTTTPAETLARVVEFFRTHEPIAALGIGAFGPLDLDERSPAFGSITTTPKLGWASVSLGSALGVLGVPLAIDTDVNAAALGEHRWGALRGFDTAVYVTVGTGIGGGGLAHSRLLHGLVHPEMGHIRVPHDRAADPFPGICPFHGDCWEGLASGVAMRERWGTAPERLPRMHPAWALEAHYLGVGLATLVGVLSPERIVLGGGVARAPGLLGEVRAALTGALGGYARAGGLTDAIDDYVVAPALGDRSGVLGALALGLDRLRASPPAAGT